MKMNEILQKKHIFFIGVGGISMSGLALLMENNGFTVSGSDINKSKITENLIKKNIKVYYKHSKNNIKSDVDLVVFSGAIAKNNEEILFAQENNIMLMERSEFLGKVCGLFKNVIAVSGTHGKTTTTALIGDIFVNAGLNPTIHVGGEVNSGYNNFRIGGDNFFITESCEYKKSLEHVKSNIAVVTNIERDHMDCYSDIKDLYKSFNIFLNKASEKAILSDYKNLQENLHHKNLIFCGENETSLYYVKNIKLSENKKYSFSVYKKNINSIISKSEKDKLIGNFNLNVYGKYNVYNAFLAVVVALQYNIRVKTIYKTLNEFKGIKRRNEEIGFYNGVKVVADYAHHPTEIKESIASFKKLYGKVLVVFQPHTYSRTVALREDFIKCFKGANNLIVYKTYPAREEEQVGGTETDLFNYINYKKKNKKLALTYDELKKAVNEKIKNNNVMLILGAGDLYDYIDKILNITK